MNNINTQSDLKKIVESGSLILLGMFLAKLLGILHQIILARSLAPSDYGIFSISISILSIFLTISMFGLGSGAVRYTAKYIGLSKKENLIKLINFSVLFCIFSSVLLSTIIYLSRDYLLDFLNLSNYRLVIYFLLVALPLKSFLTILTSIYRGHSLTLHYVKYVEIYGRLIKIIFFTYFFYIGFGLEAAFFSFVLGTILVVILFANMFHKQVHPLDVSFNFDSDINRKVLNYSFPLYFSSILSFIILEAGIIFLAVYETSKDVGIYKASVGIASLLYFIGLSFSFLSFPSLTKLYVSQKIREMKTVFLRITKYRFFLVQPLFFIMLFYSSRIIDILFGSEYVTGASVLCIVSLGVAFNVSVGSTGTLLQSMGRSKSVLLADISGVFANILLNVLLIPNFGIEGAAIATSVSLTIRNIVTLLMIYSNLNFIPFTALHLKSIIISSIFFTATWIFSELILANILYFPFLQFFSDISVAANTIFVVYTIVLIAATYYSYHLLGFLDKEDYQILRDLINREINFK